MERANLVVSGCVQGVFFLVGGEKEKVEGLISAVREGPPMSNVEAVDVSWMEYRREFADFRISW